MAHRELPPGPGGLGGARGAQHRGLLVAPTPTGVTAGGPRRSGHCRPSRSVDRLLLDALRRLPVRQREVIALPIFLDLDTDATAKHLGIAPGTVTAHLSRAVTALRHELTPAEI